MDCTDCGGIEASTVTYEEPYSEKPEESHTQKPSQLWHIVTVILLILFFIVILLALLNLCICLVKMSATASGEYGPVNLNEIEMTVVAPFEMSV